MTSCRLSPLARAGVHGHRPNGPRPTWADRASLSAKRSEECGYDGFGCLARGLTNDRGGPPDGRGDATVLGTMTAVPLPSPPGRPILRHMTGVTVPGRNRLHLSVLVASSLALLLLALASGTAVGHASIRLTDPVVSPSVAVAGTPISFGVTFSDANGVAPKSVSALIDGNPIPMTGSGPDYTAGVRFSATARPAVGTHQIHFRAVDSSGHVDEVAAPNLVINPAPSPTPKPNPTATPKPVPSPTSVPTPTRAPAASSAPTSAPIKMPAPSTATGSGGSTGSGSGTGSGGSVTEPTSGPGGATGGSTGATPGGQSAETAGPAGSATSSPTPRGASTNSARGALAQYELTRANEGGGVPSGNPFGFLTSQNASSEKLLEEMLPTVATGTAVVVTWAAFAIFGKRRRDDDDDGLLATAAATAYEIEAAPGLHVVDESMMPRWRRPSLQQVRRTDPLRATAAAAPSLSFASAGVRPLDNYERRHISYRLVRLLDSPDELRSAEIGILDQGDEVQLLERHGAYWLVLCPDGRQGWVHRMVLANPDTEVEPEPEPEPMPQYVDEYDAPEVAASFEEPSADGLLEAYLRAREEAARLATDEESQTA